MNRPLTNVDIGQGLKSPQSNSTWHIDGMAAIMLAPNLASASFMPNQFWQELAQYRINTKCLLQ